MLVQNARNKLMTKFQITTQKFVFKIESLKYQNTSFIFSTYNLVKIFKDFFHKFLHIDSSVNHGAGIKHI